MRLNARLTYREHDGNIYFFQVPGARDPCENCDYLACSNCMVAFLTDTLFVLEEEDEKRRIEANIARTLRLNMKGEERNKDGTFCREGVDLHRANLRRGRDQPEEEEGTEEKPSGAGSDK